VIVIDPFSSNCAVVTGAHNFSATASQQNDEDFLVIKGNRKLAEAYAVNCIPTYDHYRWREYLQECELRGVPPWSHLRDSPEAWQRQTASGHGKENLEFWLGRGTSGVGGYDCVAGVGPPRRLRRHPSSKEEGIYKDKGRCGAGC
jgi:phosphatidylserine/phosphatidylglycerophosphate/cardiolipin synthase-like enzyme